MPSFSDTQKVLGKVGGASLATLLLIGALERNTQAVNTLKDALVAGATARAEEAEARRKVETEERETRFARELAVAKDQAESLRRLLELREAEAARRLGSPS